MLDLMQQTWRDTARALAAIANQGRYRPAARRIVSLNTKRFVRGRPHQGHQEMARRRRQIASGMLRPENGVLGAPL